MFLIICSIVFVLFNNAQSAYTPSKNECTGPVAISRDWLDNGTVAIKDAACELGHENVICATGAYNKQPKQEWWFCWMDDNVTFSIVQVDDHDVDVCWAVPSNSDYSQSGYEIKAEPCTAADNQMWQAQRAYSGPAIDYSEYFSMQGYANQPLENIELVNVDIDQSVNWSKDDSVLQTYNRSGHNQGGWKIAGVQ